MSLQYKFVPKKRTTPMAHWRDIRAELDLLRGEILALQTNAGETTEKEPLAEPSAAKPEVSLKQQMHELNAMVKSMIDDAEASVAEHPVATVAGALALGIVIGRLTAD